MSNTPIVMYIIMRRDLLTTLKWPIGAAMAQTCHAVSAILWKFRDSQNVSSYMENIGSMRKVVLEIENEASLRELSEKLSGVNIDHELWIEQPENIATCIAVKPYLKTEIHKHLKHLKLFS